MIDLIIYVLAVFGAVGLILFFAGVACALFDGVDPCQQAEKDKEALIRNANKRRAF